MDSGWARATAARLAEIALARPRTVLFGFLAAVLALAPGVALLEIDVDGRALVPTGAPELEVERELRRRFDVRDMLAVVVERRGERGIFDAHALAFVARASAALTASEGSDSVTSLATEKSDRVRPRSFEFAPWLEPLPETRAELDQLAASLAPVGIFRGTLLSTDEPPTSTAILVREPERAARSAWIGHVQRLVADAAPPVDVELHFVGSPVVEAGLGEHVLDDLRLRLPLAVLALTLVFALAFRSAVAVAVAGCEIACAVAVVFGAMGYCGSSVVLTSAVIPVILTALGVTDEIHVLSAFRARRAEHAGEALADAIRAVYASVGAPVIATSLTTACGFLAFALSPLELPRSFGVYTALGVLVCLAWTLLVVPAALLLFGARIPPRARAGPTSIGRLVQLVASFARRRAAWILAGGTALAAALALGAARLRVDDNWISGFAPGSRVRASTELVEGKFGGSHLLYAAVEAEALRASGRAPMSALRERALELPLEHCEPIERLVGHRVALRAVADGRENALAGWTHIVGATRSGSSVVLELDPRQADPARRISQRDQELAWEIDGADRLVRPEVLAVLREFEQRLAQLTELGVGRVVGPYEHFAAMHYLSMARGVPPGSVPSDPTQIGTLMEHYGRVRGAVERARVFEGQGRAGLVTLFLRDASFRSTLRVTEAVRAVERELLSPLGLRLAFAGDAAVGRATVAAITQTQTRSLGFGLVAIALCMALVLSSARLAVIAALPASFATLATFACMGVFDVPLGVSTSMFAAMTLGVGVDYAIHFVDALRTRDFEQACADVGPPIVLDLAAVGCAFGLFVASDVPTNARLGALVIAGLCGSFAATLLVVPACARWIRPRAQ